MDEVHLSKHKVFYGYWILAAAFVSNFISSGCGTYAFSLFVKSLEADFGWGRGDIMVAFTLIFLTMALAGPPAGRLIDRYGVRKVLAIGALVVGLGFVCLSLISSIWHFYVGSAVVGAGIAAIGPIPATAVVSNWFNKRRGTAVGIASAGIGAGGFVIAPLIGGYLIPNFGWRAAYLALALIAWVVITLLALLVIRTKPADMGLYPDGAETSEAVNMTEALSSASEGFTLKMALATSAFWLISVSYFMSQFGQMGAIQNQVPFLEDIGFPVVTAATALGGVGLGSLIGKFGFGWLCDRIAAKYACAIGLGLQAGSIIVLMSIGPASPVVMIWLYAIMMGLGVGSWVPTLSMLTSTNFGLASYGTIFGMVALFNNCGVAIGPLVVGYLYDAMNTYHWAFIILAVSYIVSIPAVLAIRRPKLP